MRNKTVWLVWTVLVWAALVMTGCGVAKPELHSVEAGGLSISYLERPAKGPLVILLHGFPDTAHTWDSISAQLNQRGFRTVAPFLRGYPPTALPTEDTTILQLGRDVLALMDALHADKAILIGQDWGASAAYTAANLAPDRISHLITIAIPHPLAFAKHPEALQASAHFPVLSQPGAAEGFRANDFAQMQSILAQWSPNWAFPANEIKELKAAFSKEGALEAVLGYYRAFAAAPPDPVIFQQTKVPTLTLYGTQDGAGSLAPFVDQQIGFTLPVRVVALQAGHFVHREREAETMSEILRFLNE